MKNILTEASISKDKIDAFDESQLEVLVDYVISTQKTKSVEDDYKSLADDNKEEPTKSTKSSNIYGNIGSAKAKTKGK